MKTIYALIVKCEEIKMKNTFSLAWVCNSVLAIYRGLAARIAATGRAPRTSSATAATNTDGSSSAPVDLLDALLPDGIAIQPKTSLEKILRRPFQCHRC